jgi:hypothetical protein
MISYKDKYLKYKNKYLYLKNLQKEKMNTNINLYGGASASQIGASVILRHMIKDLLNQMEQNGTKQTEAKKFHKVVDIKVNLDKIVHSNDKKLEKTGTHNDLYDPTYSYNPHITGILDTGKRYVTHCDSYDKLEDAIKLASLPDLSFESSRSSTPVSLLELRDDAYFPLASSARSRSQSLSRSPSPPPPPPPLLPPPPPLPTSVSSSPLNFAERLKGSIKISMPSKPQQQQLQLQPPTPLPPPTPRPPQPLPFNPGAEVFTHPQQQQRQQQQQQQQRRPQSRK